MIQYDHGIITTEAEIMDDNRALAIVSALANGVNPWTGEIFPADSPYQTADVVRALFLARRALETKSPEARSRQRSNAPANAGKPWTEEEDRSLLQEFDSGCRIPDLAHAHSRTTAGIQARLEKHGRLQMQAAGLRNRQHDQRSASDRVDSG